MSKTKPGDTFTIEIDREYKDGSGRTLYGVKGFNTLVFDDVGVSKLNPLKKKYSEEEADKIKEKAFEDGRSEAWALSKRIQKIVLGKDEELTRNDYHKIFGNLIVVDMLDRFTPEKAQKKIDEFLRSKKDGKENGAFSVGDILQIRGHDKKCIITDIEEGQYCHLLREDGRCFWAKIDTMEGEYEKTGNNQGIVKTFLKNIDHITIEI